MHTKMHTLILFYATSGRKITAFEFKCIYRLTCKNMRTSTLSTVIFLPLLHLKSDKKNRLASKNKWNKT